MSKKIIVRTLCLNVLFTVLLSVFMASCTKPEQEPSIPENPDGDGLVSISFSVKDTSVFVNESFPLDIIYNPAEVNSDTVNGVWRVSDETVLSVSEAGVVTGLKATGDDKAVVRYTVSETIFAECSVRVRELPLPGEIALSQELLYMEIGDTEDVNVVTSSSDDYTHSDLWWASSDESVATVSSTGEITAVGNGAVCIMASIGELSAYCFVNVFDPDYPTEYDDAWLNSPYPYLEYPTERDRILAAENIIGEGPLMYRKLVEEDGGILTFRLRDYFGQGISSPMFEEVFYDLNPDAGAPIAWGNARGITSNELIISEDGPSIMEEMMLEAGYTFGKEVDLGDGLYGGWFFSELQNRSCLIYVVPSIYEADRLMGVMEWRVLSDDPMNDGE